MQIKPMHLRTAMKKKTELRGWIDQQYGEDPALRQRVNELMSQMEIEQGLVALRQDRRISQKTLAKMIGVSQPAIAKLESGGAKNIELRTLARYVGALGGRLKIEIIKDKPGAGIIGLRRQTAKG